MWILPKNHPLYSVYAQDFSLDLIEDLKQYWEENPEPLLMWKSKPLSWPILLRAWKRVYWMRYLCGRILKPSLGPSFEEKWIGSLEDTHANRLAMQENGGGQKIHVTSGPILPKVFEQLDLWGASSKTLVDTLHLGMRLLGENYKIWVIELRKEYSLRKKLERPTEESGSLSLRSWGTPRAFMHKDALEDRNKGNLGEQVMNPTNWPTQTVMATRKEMDLEELKLVQQKVKQEEGNGNGFGLNLHQAVRSWPTPTSRDYKDGSEQSCQNVPSNGLLGREVHWKEHGQVDKSKNNINGKNQGQLNPAWVAQLMGTTLEKIFFVGKVTE